MGAEAAPASSEGAFKAAVGQQKMGIVKRTLLKIPPGVREWVLFIPMAFVLFGGAWSYTVNTESNPLLIKPQHGTYRDYNLEPVYDEKGKVQAYRRVPRHSGGGEQH